MALSLLGFAFAAGLISIHPPGTEEIHSDIDQIFSRMGHRMDVREGIRAITKHGTNAVPVILERYLASDQRQRELLAGCLCEVPTKEGLNFLKQIIRRREDRWATREAIAGFPLEQEDEITLILANIIAQGPSLEAMQATDRLKQMIFRKPARAGDLVDAMVPSEALVPSEAKMPGTNYYIGEVLALVSGYEHTWCCWGSLFNPGAQRSYWEQWWSRNKDKERLFWLVEAFESDAKNGSRRERALGGMAGLGDSRAIPYLVKALDDPDDSVRYTAVVGLQRLADPLKRESISWETYQLEKEAIVKRLKERFKTPVKTTSP